MNNLKLKSALLTTIAITSLCLSGCDKTPAVVNVPATPVVVPEPVLVPVPGPAGASGEKGDTGDKGNTGKTGDSNTTVIVQPAAEPAPAAAAPAN